VGDSVEGEAEANPACNDRSVLIDRCGIGCAGKFGKGETAALNQRLRRRGWQGVGGWRFPSDLIRDNASELGEL
jgi:hypothetical protein